MITVSGSYRRRAGHVLFRRGADGADDPAEWGTLKRLGVKYRVQDESFVTDDELRGFMSGFEHILVHFDIDVLDEHFFHSTYFANPELVGDGSGGGRMTTEQTGRLLKLIGDESDVVGFTAAEYLPFDEHRLHKMFSGLSLFTE